MEYGDLNDLFGQDAFSDFFRSIFGGMGGARTAIAPADGASLSAAHHASVWKRPIAAHPRAFQSDDRQLSVRIPAGVKTGSKVRAAGAAPDGQDLYLIVEVTG